jgi:hypothetical protein
MRSLRDFLLVEAPISGAVPRAPILPAHGPARPRATRPKADRGEINHKDRSHPGEHEPIIERVLFEAVQARLDEQRRGKRRSRTSSDALLLGRIFDERGNRMTPSYAVKNGARYRYYVSCARKSNAGELGSAPPS